MNSNRSRRRGNRRNKRPRRRNNRRGNGNNHAMPRNIFLKPVMTRTIRYETTGALDSSNPITGLCLLNAVLAGVSGSTTAINLYEGVRIRRIKIYAVSTGLVSDIQLNWRGVRGDDVRISSVGAYSRPASIDSRPPRNTLCGFWINNITTANEQLFSIDAPSNTLIDLTIDYVVGDGATRSCTIVDPGLTGIGYAALDNANTSGTVGNEEIQPLGLTYFNMTTPSPKEEQDKIAELTFTKEEICWYRKHRELDFEEDEIEKLRKIIKYWDN